MFIAACVKKIHSLEGRPISTASKTLSKIAKLTLMVRFINRTGSSRTEFPTQIPKLHKHNLYVLYTPSS